VGDKLANLKRHPVGFNEKRLLAGNAFNHTLGWIFAVVLQHAVEQIRIDSTGSDPTCVGTPRYHKPAYFANSSTGKAARFTKNCRLISR